MHRSSFKTIFVFLNTLMIVLGAINHAKSSVRVDASQLSMQADGHSHSTHQQSQVPDEAQSNSDSFEVDPPCYDCDANHSVHFFQIDLLSDRFFALSDSLYFSRSPEPFLRPPARACLKLRSNFFYRFIIINLFTYS